MANSSHAVQQFEPGRSSYLTLAPAMSISTSQSDTGKEVYTPERSWVPDTYRNKDERASQTAVFYNPIGHQQRQKRICGLRWRWFWLSVVIILAIVAALSTAGGVLASKASAPASSSVTNGGQSKDSPSPVASTTRSSSPSASGDSGISASITSTSSTNEPTDIPLLPTSSSVLSSPIGAATTAPDGSLVGINTCPKVNNTQYRPSESKPFTALCGTDWTQGSPAAPNSQTDKVENLAVSLADSLVSCIDQCATWNENKNKTQMNCQAVIYRYNITDTLYRLKRPGNCFLKNAKGKSWMNAPLAVAGVLEDT